MTSEIPNNSWQISYSVPTRFARPTCRQASLFAVRGPSPTSRAKLLFKWRFHRIFTNKIWSWIPHITRLELTVSFLVDEEFTSEIPGNITKNALFLEEFVSRSGVGSVNISFRENVRSLNALKYDVEWWWLSYSNALLKLSVLSSFSTSFWSEFLLLWSGSVGCSKVTSEGKSIYLQSAEWSNIRVATRLWTNVSQIWRMLSVEDRNNGQSKQRGTECSRTI